MKLGILVTTNTNKDNVKGLTKAAVSKGHEVSIFCMGEGSRLLEEKDFMDLNSIDGVSMAFCDHSAGISGSDDRQAHKGDLAEDEDRQRRHGQRLRRDADVDGRSGVLEGAV